MIKINETKSYTVYEHQKVLVYFYKKIGYSVRWYANTMRTKYDYRKNDILNEFMGSPQWSNHVISTLDDKTPEETFEKDLPDLLTRIADNIDIQIRRCSKLNTKKDEDKFFCKAYSNHKVDKDWEI